MNVNASPLTVAPGAMSPSVAVLSVTVGVLVASSLLVQCIESAEFNLPLIGARLAPMSSMAMAIGGLVLVEQVFRNVSADSRWSVKPSVSVWPDLSLSTYTSIHTP